MSRLSTTTSSERRSALSDPTNGLNMLRAEATRDISPWYWWFHEDLNILRPSAAMTLSDAPLIDAIKFASRVVRAVGSV